MKQNTPVVGLFVTCLVDFFRPSVGFAAVDLLTKAGCRVRVPRNQTCCGQPAYNSGDQKTTQTMARKVISTFQSYDYVVVPSGSCAGMIRHHYPSLFQEDSTMAERAQRLAAKTFELVSFLVDVMKFKGVDADYPGRVTYHDSCSGLRELGVKAQPRKLLKNVSSLSLSEMDDPEACCGFGGTFCVKYSSISGRVAERKVDDILSTKADTLLAGDMGCLLNMAGSLKRSGSGIDVRHVAEVLAGMTESCKPIGGETK